MAVKGQKHHPAVWAIREGTTIELYDLHPFEPDAVRLADFRAEDFELYCGMTLHEHTPQMVRLRSEIARNR